MRKQFKIMLFSVLPMAWGVRHGAIYPKNSSQMVVRE
jgi:hypothetical protein